MAKTTDQQRRRHHAGPSRCRCAAAMQAAAAAGCLRRQKAAQWKAAPPRPRAQQPSCWTTQHPRRRGPGRRRGSCSGRRPSRRALGRTCQAQARRRCMGTLPCAGDSIFVRLNLFWQTNQQRMKQPSSVSMAQDSCISLQYQLSQGKKYALTKVL